MSDDDGFKGLTPENAYELDPTASTFIAKPIGQGVNNMTVKDWNRLFLGPQLVCPVPEGIIRMFDVARGMACYGCYFYPMYQQSFEQLFRVLEAAAVSRFEQLDGPKDKHHRTYETKLNWLAEMGEVDDDIKGRWHASRSLRNSYSHATNPWVTMPSTVASQIDLTAALITALWGDGSLPDRFKPHPEIAALLRGGC